MMRYSQMIVAIFIMLLPAMANAANKVALVIGNDDYRYLQTLHKAVQDADAMGNALRAVGYDVQFKHDLNRSKMFKAIRDFKASLKQGDEAVFFFAGHGVAIDGVANQLLPVDIPNGNADQVRDGSLALQRVLDDLRKKHVRLSMVIIDACRDNPFQNRTRSFGSRGLVRERTAEGQMVIYSAGDGQRALDSLGAQDPDPNGVFTRVFLKEMKRPGANISEVVRNVRKKVAILAKSVGEKQVPAVYDQVIGDFYFVPAITKDKKETLEKEELLRKNMQLEQQLAQIKKQSAGKDKETVSATSSGGTTILESLANIFTEVEAPRDKVGTVRLQQETIGNTQIAGIDMITIPGGDFKMGSNNGDADEKPVHRVQIESFQMGKYEVTQAQWVMIMGKNPSYVKDDNYPIVSVSWYDVQNFIHKLNLKTGQSFRLPSEAEWEYAARAGKIDEKWGWGNSKGLANKYAWYSSNSGVRIHPVGTKKANTYGLYDMHGNAWEWVQDCYNSSYIGASHDGSARESGHCNERVLRGGSYWSNDAKDMRSANRHKYTSSASFSYTRGFRIALDHPN